MRILSVRLGVSDGAAAGAQRFYQAGLGLPATAHGFRAGHTTVELAPAETEPFYHFALRVPRNRFAATREWIGRHAEILGDARFDNWNAEACYVEDPAGNIVELIAHGWLSEESSDEGPFRGEELLGICELGLVGPDTRAMAGALEELGVELWDGSLEPERLAFMGARDGVFILSPEGRGWMPTERPAEPHPVEATVAGDRAAEVVLPGTQHRIRTVVEG